MKYSKDLSVSMSKANYWSLLFAIPPAVLFIAVYLLIWGKHDLQTAWQLIGRRWLIFVLILAAAIFLHEFIHALTWMYFGRKPFSAMRFGFNLKALSPYAHCNEPMTAHVYRLGALMPGLLLGIIPALAGLISGNGLLMLFGVLFTVAAGGDMLILWLLRQEPASALVMDHPTHAGCLLIQQDFPENGNIK